MFTGDFTISLPRERGWCGRSGSMFTHIRNNQRLENVNEGVGKPHVIPVIPVLRFSEAPFPCSCSDVNRHSKNGHVEKYATSNPEIAIRYKYDG